MVDDVLVTAVVVVTVVVAVVVVVSHIGLKTKCHFLFY